MFISSFASGQWQSNCYLVGASAAPGSDCVIVDPGWGSDKMARKLVERHKVRPVAILLTHGHIDHVGSAASLAAEYEIETWIHPADRKLLREPGSGLPRDWAPMLKLMIGKESLPEPWLVKELEDKTELDLGGVGFSLRQAPGHTPGSVLALCDYPDDPETAGVLFSGDVLFAGAIGRTDLPGGDSFQMGRSIETEILTLDDSIVALPGHGSQTSIGRERATNPYLQSDFWRNQS